MERLFPYKAGGVIDRWSLAPLHMNYYYDYYYYYY